MGAVGVCLAGYASGLILAQFLTLALQPGLSLCTLLFFFLFLTRSNLSLVLLNLLILSLLIGLMRYPLSISPSGASARLDALVGQEIVRLEGEVLATHERQGGGFAVDLVLQKSSGDYVGSISGSRLRLYSADAGQYPLIGSRIAFRSKIRKTRKFDIPGEFDYPRHLAYQKIWHTAYLKNSQGLAIFFNSSSDLNSRIGEVRWAGLNFIASALDPDGAVLLKALLLGEKGGMSRGLRQKLAAGGVSHLFAISGLHLGLLAFLAYVILRFLYSRSTSLLLWQPPSRVLWLPVIPPLFCYLLLTGDALATRRAFYALLITVSLYLFRRRIEPVQLLITLAFLFLLIEPLALWQPSFLLSFSGVFGILLWQKPLQGFVRPFPVPLRKPLQLIGISCAAVIGTLPATLFFFHLFAPAGIVTNIIAIPLVSFVALPLGLAGLGIGFFLPTFGSWLLQLSAWVLQLVVELADFISNLEWLSPHSLFLTIPELTGILVGCLALLIGMQKRRAVLLLIPAVVLYVYQPSAVVVPELTMFSVGQGESILLRLEGKAVLVDGGGLRSENFDVGERLLAPALGRLGVKRLDAIVLTHNHPDHSKGLNYIIEEFPVKEFWSSGDFTDLPARLSELLTEKNVSIYKFDGDWGRPVVAGLEQISLFVAQINNATENDRSLCVYFPSTAGGVLLTGDLEAAGIDALIKNPPPGPVELLKVPHHGSRKSDPAQLLAAFNPQAVVVSAGFGNAYGFPSQQLLNQVETQQVNLWRTDQDGTIHLRAEGQHWQIVH